MPFDLAALVAPAHTALVLQEVQNGVVGTPSVLPALAEAAAAVDLGWQLRLVGQSGARGRGRGGALHGGDARRRQGREPQRAALPRL